MITVKMEGGPLDGQIIVLAGDPKEHRFMEAGRLSPQEINDADKLVPTIEHIYKKSERDPHIFWYAGSAAR